MAPRRFAAVKNTGNSSAEVVILNVNKGTIVSESVRVGEVEPAAEVRVIHAVSPHLVVVGLLRSTRTFSHLESGAWTSFDREFGTGSVASCVGRVALLGVSLRIFRRHHTELGIQEAELESPESLIAGGAVCFSPSGDSLACASLSGIAVLKVSDQKWELHHQVYLGVTARCLWPTDTESEFRAVCTWSNTELALQIRSVELTDETSEGAIKEPTQAAHSLLLETTRLRPLCGGLWVCRIAPGLVTPEWPVRRAGAQFFDRTNDLPACCVPLSDENGYIVQIPRGPLELITPPTDSERETISQWTIAAFRLVTGAWNDQDGGLYFAADTCLGYKASNGAEIVVLHTACPPVEFPAI